MGIIIKHLAELSLALSVWHLFERCHSVGDAFKIVRDLNDVTRLGLVAVISIAMGGVAGMVKAAVHGFRLPDAIRLLHRLFAFLATRRRKPGRRRRPGGQDR